MSETTETERVEHTDGEWRWYWREEDGRATGSVYTMRRPGQAYAIAICPQYQKREQWEADAQLIAAAPELLAACDAALGTLPAEGDDVGSYRSKVAAKIRSALAKARGGEG